MNQKGKREIAQSEARDKTAKIEWGGKCKRTGGTPSLLIPSIPPNCPGWDRIFV